MLHTEFIHPCPRGMSIITNSIPNPSNLTIMEKHFKSIEGANISQMVTYLFVIGALESWKVQRCKV